MWYRCVNGSQFDTNRDGYGDRIALGTRCKWNKKWQPYSDRKGLPACKITHCVEPFEIPPDTALQVFIQNISNVEVRYVQRCR